MQIDIPPSEQQRLAEHAKAAGYDDVERYVTEQVLDLAHQPMPSELPPLEEATSREMLRRGEADIAAGRTRDMREALEEIGAKRGFTRGQ